MPIRKSDSKPLMITSTQGKNVKSGPYLSKMSRKELEDSFSRLQEESLLVKELSWKQEDQIKRMRTKLLRLTAEGRTSGDASRPSRNLKAEETIENLKDQVWQLQRHNEGLNNRLLMYKQQLQVQSSGRSPYSYVQPRINTGRHRLHTSDAHISAKLKRAPPTRPSYTAPPIYKEHLTEEVRAEMPSEPVQIMTNNSVKVDELELSPKSPEKMWSKDEECEEKSSSEHAQLATEYRASIRENVERIQVMRLLHERSSALVAAKAQLADLQESERLRPLKDWNTGRVKEEKDKDGVELPRAFSCKAVA
uniref:X-linked retinitis pigmentosa GTPase regulator-interacting protein 1-like n=1 Tax=Phascolarctos cinereus TaxID=38626 RepID=A0A6P5K567_PHACI|nr:X-linked retinitis pigmentosa GTPase regulator-interacting protein 1-like [Phascolarctos cinereus]